MLFELTARNVANIDEFKEQISSQFSAENEKIRTWIDSNYRRWLINHGPAVTLTELPDNAPEWLQKAFSAGQEVHVILYDVALRTLRPIVDYFRHVVEQGDNIDRISVQQAAQKQHDWHEELKNTGGVSDIDEDHIIKVLQHDDGYSWVKILGKKSLEREGDIMGHCVGGYYNSVAAGRVAIYSLRDPKNIPHLTLEVGTKYNQLEQAKAKGNDPVPPKYMEKLMDLLANIGIKRFSEEALEEDLTNTTPDLITEAYERRGLSVPPKVTDETLGDYRVNTKDSTVSVPSFEGKIEIVVFNRDKQIAHILPEKSFNIELTEDIDPEDIGSDDLVKLLANTWLKNCRYETYHGTKVSRINVLCGLNTAFDSTIFRNNVRAAAGEAALAKCLKYTEGNNKLVIARSTIDSQIIQSVCGWVNTNTKELRHMNPNMFILSKNNKVKLAASVSFKNFVLMYGKVTDAIKPLIDKVSVNKTFVSKSPDEVIKYGKEIEFDTAFTYLSISPEIKNVLHRGIFPSQKFNRIMHELYQITSLEDYVKALTRNGLLGKPNFKLLHDVRVVQKYKADPRYKVVKLPYGRRSSYKVTDLESVKIANQPTRHNVKAFFASLFCSPRTRKFLLKLIQQNTPAGKAMLYLFRLCANPVKLANAMLYGYDESHLRKNLVAAAKLVRNLDKFFDREEIKDGKILAILDTIKAKRDEQQPKEQGEVNPA